MIDEVYSKRFRIDTALTSPDPTRTTRERCDNVLAEHSYGMPPVPVGRCTEKQRLEGHNRYVTTVAFSPVKLWRTLTGEELQKLEGHDSFVNAVTFSPDG